MMFTPAPRLLGWSCKVCGVLTYMQEVVWDSVVESHRAVYCINGHPSTLNRRRS